MNHPTSLLSPFWILAVLMQSERRLHKGKNSTTPTCQSPKSAQRAKMPSDSSSASNVVAVARLKKYLINEACREAVSATSGTAQSAYPIPSMYGIHTYIYHKNQPNVGKYTIHGWYGYYSSSLVQLNALLLELKHTFPRCFRTPELSMITSGGSI